MLAGMTGMMSVIGGGAFLKKQPPTFEKWHAICSSLPSGRQEGIITKNNTDYTRVANIPKLTGLTPNMIDKELEHFRKESETSSYSVASFWLDNLKAFDKEMQKPRHLYAQKLDVSPGQKIIFHGDLHGDVRSLVKSLQPYLEDDGSSDGFKLKDGFTLIMLGDYVDRGCYGLECIYTLLRLKNGNPGRVHLIRGNHEDQRMCIKYGFTKELAYKNFPESVTNNIFEWYTFLPAVLYLGCKDTYIHCSHGGFEQFYDPTRLLNAAKDVYYHALPKLTTSNGFMWSDFQVNPLAPTSFSEGRGFCFGRSHSHSILEKASSGSAKCVGVVRAHQHGDSAMMKRMLNKDGKNKHNVGVVKLWEDESNSEHDKLWKGFVATFNLCPDTPVGVEYEFGFDTHGVLTIGDKFEDWSLKVVRT